MLPSARWALTPPFHPYRRSGRKRRLVRFPFEPPQRRITHRRFIFCGTFRSRVPGLPACACMLRAAPWRYQARCPWNRSPRGPRFRSPDFPPAPHSCETAPAIARLIRQFNYTRNSCELDDRMLGQRRCQGAGSGAAGEASDSSSTFGGQYRKRRQAVKAQNAISKKTASLGLRPN
jgi:hypothetical protein